jgi:hypothetical protein
VRSSRWQLIAYAGGGRELYDVRSDPYPRPGVARSGFRVFGDEFGRDGGAELKRLVGLVVDRGDVEGVEEVGEIVGGGGAEG